ncbi:MAG: hypothetical protein QUV35_18050 [Hydrogenophaga sp.]|uniref:hypothetical protein n=1 Tax=Hydrogenophaga sp. TaxID=1904254 RepID=UPI00262C190F|nr:hypothetical protein [Hydrogenophaga sp.]MDM7944529.1 hypothetical protein [Hydrogenophaga sp.]
MPLFSPHFTPLANSKGVGFCRSPQEFLEEMNKPYLDAAIARNDELVLLTRPTPEILARGGAFLREYEYLISRGFRYESTTGKMIGGK